MSSVLLPLLTGLCLESVSAYAEPAGTAASAPPEAGDLFTAPVAEASLHFGVLDAGSNAAGTGRKYTRLGATAAVFFPGSFWRRFSMSAVGGTRNLECSRKGRKEFGTAACNAAEGWRDKRAQGALGSVGCFFWCFRRVSHCAAKVRNVRSLPIALILRRFLHIAEMRHVR